MNLRILLAEPDRISRHRLKSLLQTSPGVTVEAEAASGPEAAALARALAPDLILLDPVLPGFDGFSVLDALGPGRLGIRAVFVTSDSGFAVRAFEAGALDYLLKPLAPARLALALERARESLRAGKKEREALTPPAGGSGPETVRFAVRTGNHTRFVAAGEIDWIEAAGNYAVLHCGGRRHMVRETMVALESRLPADAFLRASRSAILNLRRVRELRTPSRGPRCVFMADGTALTLTRGSREVTARMNALRG